jgi:hypothetical protein
VATILKESGTMWRRKASLVGALCLATGCAATPNQQAARIAGVDPRQDPEVKLEGCLQAGAAPGTFVLADVSSGGAVDVMSTRFGLSAYVGRRVAVSGMEEATPPRSIHDGATLFRIRSLNLVEGECRRSG